MKYIKITDAIDTTWMILRGLGYKREENPQLERTVRKVFDTAPRKDSRSEHTDLNGKCGSCRYFEYEAEGSMVGRCLYCPRQTNKDRLYRTYKCKAYQLREEQT